MWSCLTPAARWTVDVNEFASLGRNTPLDGVELPGRVAATLVSGSIVFEEPTLFHAQNRHSGESRNP